MKATHNIFLAITIAFIVQIAKADTFPKIEKSKAQTHLDYLASDAMRGRNTPSPELELAAEYIATQFKELGLLPINGSYFHEYTLERLHLDTPTVMAMFKNSAIQFMNLKEDFIPFEYTGSGIVENAEIVFVGYGITAPEYSYDDYANIDVKGKVVVLLRGEPQANDEKSIFDGKRFTKHSRMFSKIRLAASKGAVGIIVFSDPSTTLKLKPVGFPWPSLYPNISQDALPLSRKRPGAPDIPIVHAGERIASILFGSIDSLKALQVRIDTSLKPASIYFSNTMVQSLHTTLRTEKVPVRNVMAMQSAGQKTDEYIVIGAHYDHVGAGRPNDITKDSIYNGADDNASGTTGLMLSAEAFAKAEFKPKRNIVFVAFSGEEKGLLGSKAFVDSPPLPINNCFAMFNMDMIGRGDNDTLYIGGNTRCRELAMVNEEQNRTLFESDTMMLSYTIESFFFRSDQASFAMKKIPVLFYYTGEHEDYHKVTDEMHKINFDKLVKIATLCTHTAWTTANLPEKLPFTPQPGDELQD